MNKDQMQRIISGLKRVRKTPGMYMAFGENVAASWISGVYYALAVLDAYQTDIDFYKFRQEVASELGYEDGVVLPELKKRNLSETEAADELLAIETVLWEKLLEKMLKNDNSA